MRDFCWGLAKRRPFPPTPRRLVTGFLRENAVLLRAFLIRWQSSLQPSACRSLESFLYFLLFYWIYRDPKDDPGLSAEELSYIRSEDTLPNVELGSLEVASLGYLLQRRKVIGLALGFGSYNYVFYLLLTWLPSYLSRSLHIDLLHSFLYTGVPWLFATFTDLIVGGWLVDALVQRGWNAGLVRRAVLIGGTALGIGILGAADAHTPAQALFWISLSIGGLSAAAPVGWSIPSLIAPRGSVGTVGGILNFSNQISGIAAPIVTGYLVEARHSFALAFAVAAAYLVVGIAGYIFLLGDIRRIPGQSHLAA